MPRSPGTPPQASPEPAARRNAAAALVLAAILCAGPAAADLDAARAALDAGDPAAALAELAAPELATDPAALILRGDMAASGLGAPADPVEAYAFYTRAMMLGAPDDWNEAAYLRRGLARGMGDAQIRAGEAAAVAWLDGHLWAATRAAEVAALADRLATCPAGSRDCTAAADEVFRYGPAAAATAPALEALMTRDPMWMHRDLYAYALANLGSAGAPALARAMLDPEQLRTEGGWNAALAARALGDLGPAARAQLPDLVRAASLSPGEVSTLWDDMARQLSGGADQPFEIRFAALRAVFKIGDPDRTIRAALLERGRAAPDLASALLFGWAIGMAYGEADPALDLVRQALAATDAMSRRLALGVLSDLAGKPELHDAAAALEPAVLPLATDPDPETAALVRLTLEALAAAPAGQ